jgi:hypothetical protein
MNMTDEITSGRTSRDGAKGGFGRKRQPILQGAYGSAVATNTGDIQESKHIEALMNPVLQGAQAKLATGARMQLKRLVSL